MIGDIQLQDVAVSRGGLPVITKMTCDIQAGQWLGVIGANGSGKTTLLRAVAGRLPVAAGKLLIGGVDRAGDRAWRARHIGFAPDGDTLPDALSGNELFDILTDGRSQLSASKALRPLRDALGIDHIARRRIETCSAGMRQRIAIFCAFVVGQRTVILDEPFNWLDPLAAYDLRIALRALVEDGLTMVTALHDLLTLTSSCNRGILMRDGGLALVINEDDVKKAAGDPLTFERATIEHLRRQTVEGSQSSIESRRAAVGQT